MTRKIRQTFGGIKILLYFCRIIEQKDSYNEQQGKEQSTLLTNKKKG